MTVSPEELLEKAAAQGPQLTSDFGGAGESPLSVQQVTQFIELLSAGQAILPDVRTVTSSASKWQESIIDFGGRIAKPGTEAQRLEEADRTKAGTGVVEISTVLLRAEVPVSDEVMEDNVARDGFADSLERLIADQFGYDIEDLFVNGDVSVVGSDPYLGQLDGWLHIAQASGNSYDATADAQDYQEIFKQLLVRLPDRHKRALETDFRYYVPSRLVEKYRDILAGRGTPLGDLTLTGVGELRYQGILIKGVPSFAVASGTPDTSSVLLANRNNLYAGFHRNITMETFRDPREGATSFIVTARVDAEIAVPAATSIAYNVNVEP